MDSTVDDSVNLQHCLRVGRVHLGGAHRRGRTGEKARGGRHLRPLSEPEDGGYCQTLPRGQVRPCRRNISCPDLKERPAGGKHSSGQSSPQTARTCWCTSRSASALPSSVSYLVSQPILAPADLLVTPMQSTSLRSCSTGSLRRSPTPLPPPAATSPSSPSSRS